MGIVDSTFLSYRAEKNTDRHLQPTALPSFHSDGMGDVTPPQTIENKEYYVAVESLARLAGLMQ